MCDNTDYEKCQKCNRFHIDNTIGHRNAPTESTITCSLGGVKKWIWKHTSEGIKYELVK